MARLKPKRRARLPDRAFAYVDSRGRRRLPIPDKAHVRNALARLNQVAFESDAAREQARKRLPTGFVTLLMSDIEGSTALLRALGDRYAGLLPSPLATGPTGWRSGCGSASTAAVRR